MKEKKKSWDDIPVDPKKRWDKISRQTERQRRKREQEDSYKVKPTHKYSY